MTRDYVSVDFVCDDHLTDVDVDELMGEFENIASQYGLDLIGMTHATNK